MYNIYKYYIYFDLRGKFMKKTVNKNQVSKINNKDAETFTHGEEIANFVKESLQIN